MFSILIPTYNYCVTDLVLELHKQAMELMMDFEIIVLEDGSMDFVEPNSMISKIERCRYIYQLDNIGRSAARNRLANEAKYNHLIFMDCDAYVSHSDYLRRYSNFFREEEVVVVGGTAYDASNHNPSYSLRLKYGLKREANILYHTRDSGFNNFATFNFLISKIIFNKIRFDEDIEGYGHEDTLFGHALHEAGYTFFRIDNALIHKGLDDNKTFIKKTEESVANLLGLYRSGNYPFLQKESQLLSVFSRLEEKNLIKLMAVSAFLFSPLIIWQLCSHYPSLRLYDLYKLIYLCRLAARN